MTSPAVTTRTPSDGNDSIFVKMSDEDLQRLRVVASALSVRVSVDDAACLLRVLREARVSSPSPYEHIREAYSEYASNLHTAWWQVGEYLRNAMRAVQDEREVSEA